jgi:hypothetical protein
MFAAVAGDRYYHRSERVSPLPILSQSSFLSIQPSHTTYICTYIHGAKLTTKRHDLEIEEKEREREREREM